MSQCQQVYLYLQSGHSLTPLEALNMFGILRLAARVLELKEQGYPIVASYRKQGRKRFASYSLHRPTQPDLFPVVNVVRRDGRVQVRTGDL